MGFIMVSILPSHEKIVIGTSFSKASNISSSDLPEFLIFLHLSDLFIALLKIFMESSDSRSKKGAVGFNSGVFCLKNSLCKLAI